MIIVYAMYMMMSSHAGTASLEDIGHAQHTITREAPMLSTPRSAGITATHITYFAVAENAEGKIGQLFITAERRANRAGAGARTVSQEWTGATYPSMRAACKDLSRLNAISTPAGVASSEQK
jgi:hypothetical protein